MANPDLVFPAGSLRRLVAFLDQHPEAGAVSPQLVYPDGTLQPSARRLPRLRHVLAGRRSFVRRLFPSYAPSREFLYADLPAAEEPVAVEAAIGTLLVFRREGLERVGGFDEGYFMFAEDLDICQRLGAHGFRVYVDPAVRVEHFYGGVRRRHQGFTEYHRVKALRRFFSRGRGRLARAGYSVAFAAYLSVMQAAGVIGLGEFEYSWRGAEAS